jgi:hypothetical protein
MVRPPPQHARSTPRTRVAADSKCLVKTFSHGPKTWLPRDHGGRQPAERLWNSCVE